MYAKACRESIFVCDRESAHSGLPLCKLNLARFARRLQGPRGRGAKGTNAKKFYRAKDGNITSGPLPLDPFVPLPLKLVSEASCVQFLRHFIRHGIDP
jgi:hypothetical protein